MASGISNKHENKCEEALDVIRLESQIMADQCSSSPDESFNEKSFSNNKYLTYELLSDFDYETCGIKFKSERQYSEFTSWIKKEDSCVDEYDAEMICENFKAILNCMN